MVQGFHHLAVQCSRLEDCERFYREVLGLPVVRRWPGDDGRERSVWLGVGGGGFLALERAGEPAEARPWKDARPGLHLVALRIDAGRPDRVGGEVGGGRRRGGRPDALDALPSRSRGEPGRPVAPPRGPAVTAHFARARYRQDNYLYLLVEG